MSLETIQSQLRGGDIAPGSAEEQALLMQARAAKKQDTDEFTAVKGELLEARAEANGTINPDAARMAGHEAVEHVTGQHQIVPRMPEDLGVAVPVAVEHQPLQHV